MNEILFLWLGLVALVYAFDLYDRDNAFDIPVGLIGVMSVGYYIVSVFTLPA